MKLLIIIFIVLLSACSTVNKHDCRAHAMRAIDDVFTADVLDWHASHGELDRETVSTLRDWARLYASEQPAGCLASGDRLHNGACTVSHWTPPLKQVSVRKTGELLTAWYNGAADFSADMQLQHAACTSRVCLAIFRMLPNAKSVALPDHDRRQKAFALHERAIALFERSGYFDDYSLSAACVTQPPASTSSFYLFHRP